jgi:carbamoyl-phosphate synthase small subunit
MKREEAPVALLVLQDGTVFEGRAIGAIGTTTGEIAFNTGMTGYQEIFTDPSYFGQVVVMATAHIGNYGVHTDELESSGAKISGLVVKKFSPGFSRPAASGSLQDFLVRDGVVGISDIDTRMLVRIIRDRGAMNCIISSEIADPEILKERLKQVPSMDGLELASKVSSPQPYSTGNPDADFHVAVLDFGVKRNIIRCLTDRGCRVTVLPHSATAQDVLSLDPDGIMLSNGPGDPAAMPAEREVIRALVETGIPIFGICLGHQLLALSQGLGTEKMHNGHRGINHPVKNLETGKSEVTSQNHGFVVKMSDAQAHPNITVTHVHLNDGTLAGIRLNDRACFSVQYHPESSPGPHDSRYLFDQFIESVVKHKQNVIS